MATSVKQHNKTNPKTGLTFPVKQHTRKTGVDAWHNADNFIDPFEYNPDIDPVTGEPVNIPEDVSNQWEEERQDLAEQTGNMSDKELMEGGYIESNSAMALETTLLDTANSYGLDVEAYYANKDYSNTDEAGNIKMGVTLGENEDSPCKGVALGLYADMINKEKGNVDATKIVEFSVNNVNGDSYTLKPNEEQFPPIYVPHIMADGETLGDLGTYTVRNKRGILFRPDILETIEGVENETPEVFKSKLPNPQDWTFERVDVEEQCGESSREAFEHYLSAASKDDQELIRATAQNTSLERGVNMAREYHNSRIQNNPMYNTKSKNLSNRRPTRQKSIFFELASISFGSAKAFSKGLKQDFEKGLN